MCTRIIGKKSHRALSHDDDDDFLKLVAHITDRVRSQSSTERRKKKDKSKIEHDISLEKFGHFSYDDTVTGHNAP
jgi:hypothetical protein